MKSLSFLQTLRQNPLILGDGAMGTLLQERRLLSDGGCPEALNLSHPEVLIEIHRQYRAAGSQWLQSNTFGANRKKLQAYGLASQTEELNRRGVALAHQADPEAWVLADIGPSGQLLYPLGPCSLDEMIEVYYQQAKALSEEGVDGFLIETMSDLHEAKAAVIAVKEVSRHLPIACSLTFQPGARTLTGDDPETVASVLQALGVTILGVNCGSGPQPMIEILQRMSAITDALLLVQPNAGLPRIQRGQTVFPIAPEEMAAFLPALVAAGANLIGGCCGTTPQHIAAMRAALSLLQAAPKKIPSFSTLSGFGQTVLLGDRLPTRFIGERINPTARKKLAEALRQGQYEQIAQEAEQQLIAGAAILDLNVSLPTAPNSESERLEQLTLACQRRIQAPLSLDTLYPENMEAALKVMRGKPLLNSTNGDEEHLQKVCRLAARYGAAILGLTLDQHGIPETAEERMVIARRIVEAALAHGIRRADIYIDGLTLTAGASQALLPETLALIRRVKQELGVRTILGISNVSYGLPQRPFLNTAFLMMAMEAGLDTAILNPFQPDLLSYAAAADVLLNRDGHAAHYIELSPTFTPAAPAASLVTAVPSITQQPHPAVNEPLSGVTLLRQEILHGSKEQIQLLLQRLLQQGMPPLEIVNTCILPALEEVGDRYDRKVYFLPQLLLAAEAAQATLAVLQPLLQQVSEQKQGTVILATVQGDIHDIGKGIVGLLLQNHGFRVIDLGKDVPNERVIQAAIDEKADFIALSALMTTTIPQMGKICQMLRERGLQIPVMVGGAVVDEAYAREIGALYGADATDAVRLAKTYTKRGNFS